MKQNQQFSLSQHNSTLRQYISSPSQHNPCSTYCSFCKNTKITLITISANSYDPLNSLTSDNNLSLNIDIKNKDPILNNLPFYDTNIPGDILREQLKKFDNKYMCEQCISRIHQQIRELADKKNNKITDTNQLPQQQQDQKYTQNNKFIGGTLSLLINESRKEKVQICEPKSSQTQLKNYKSANECSILGIISNSSQQDSLTEEQPIVSSKKLFELGIISNQDSEKQEISVSIKDDKQYSQVSQILQIEQICKNDIYKERLFKILIKDMRKKQKDLQKEQQQNIRYLKNQYQNINKVVKKGLKKIQKDTSEQLLIVRKQFYKSQKSICTLCNVEKIVINQNNKLLCLDCYIDANITAKMNQQQSQETIQV